MKPGPAELSEALPWAGREGHPALSLGAGAEVPGEGEVPGADPDLGPRVLAGLGAALWQPRALHWPDLTTGWRAGPRWGL